MKKIFCILWFWAGTASANTINHVWIPYAGGVLETQCRLLWNEYDVKHGSNTVFFVKPGANGMLAVQDMLNFSSERKFMCGGTADALPENNNMETLLQISVNAMVWYVPNNNKAQNFSELIAHFKQLNRPINVGTFFATQKTFANYLAKIHNLNINIVTYRSSPQMYPDLASGSLDLAFDSGGAVELAQSSEKFRIAGYIASNDLARLAKYPNFKSSGSDFPMFYSWLGIMIPSNMSKENKMAVTEELRNIVLQKSFKERSLQNLSTITGIGQPEITKLIQQQRKIFLTYQ